jgi:hypothetical protein
MKRIFAVSILIIITLSACGAAPAPTMNLADAQNTAVAAAWLAVTQTQAALPTVTLAPTSTSTPVPPTETPASIVTLFPTVPPQEQSVPLAGAATVDPCNQIPTAKPKGLLVSVKFINKTEGDVNLSFGMATPNKIGECFTYSYTLGRYDAPVVKVLAGCYWGYGWVTGNKPSTTRTTKWLCLTDPAQEPDVWIGVETINFH